MKDLFFLKSHTYSIFHKGLANSVRNAFVCPDVFMEPVLKPLNVLVMMDMREWFAINVWKILQNYITYK